MESESAPECFAVLLILLDGGGGTLNVVTLGHYTVLIRACL